MKSLLVFSALILAASVSAMPRHTLTMKQRPMALKKSKKIVTGDSAVHRGGWRAVGNTFPDPISGGSYTAAEFFAEITVGTGRSGSEGQMTFEAIVDTGSSNTAIPGNLCSNCGAKSGKVYDPSLSPTSSPLLADSAMCRNCVPTEVGSVSVPFQNKSCMFGAPMSVTYPTTGDSSTENVCGFGISYGGSYTATEGVTFQDTICFGDTTKPSAPSSLCAKEAFVNVFTKQYPAATQSTGILGLAFPHNSCCPTCQPPIMDSLVASGALQPEENMFGMCLTPEKGGYIDFGGLNQTRFAPGTMNYTKVVKEHWYNIEVKDVLVGGLTTGAPSFLYGIVNDGIGAFADSGTRRVLLAPEAYSMFTDLLLSDFSSLPKLGEILGQKTGLFQSGCANMTEQEVETWPTISFKLAGMGVGGGSDDFTVEMGPQRYLMPLPNNENHRCFGISPVPSIGLILGDIIMQDYYIHFDRVNRRLGFAPLIPGMC